MGNFGSLLCLFPSKTYRNKRNKNKGQECFFQKGRVFLSQYYTIFTLDLYFSCFCMFFMFWEERDIKVKQKYTFIHIFNKNRLERQTELNSCK